MGDEADSLAEGRKVLAGLIQDVLGPGAKEMGATIADQARLFRWKRAASIFERARSFANKRGIEPGEIPYSFLVPFLEKSSISDEDENLTDAWANLLVSAAAGVDARHRLFTDLLGDLDREEAEFLKSLFHQAYGDRKGSAQVLPYYHTNAMENLHAVVRRAISDLEKEHGSLSELSYHDFANVCAPSGFTSRLIRLGASSEAALHDIRYPSISDDLAARQFRYYHLERLGLITTSVFPVLITRPSDSDGDLNIYLTIALLTPLGYQFIAVCEGIRGLDKDS